MKPNKPPRVTYKKSKWRGRKVRNRQWGIQENWGWPVTAAGWKRIEAFDTERQRDDAFVAAQKTAQSLTRKLKRTKLSIRKVNKINGVWIPVEEN